MRVRSPLLSSVLAGLLALSATGFSAADDVAAKSDNIEHVKQIQYEDRYDTGINQGTDLEFMTRDLPARVAAKHGLTGPGTRGGSVERTYSLAGSYNNGLQIIDVTDPARSEIVAVYDCAISQGDVQVFERGGRWYVAYADDDYTRPPGSRCFTEAQAAGFDPSTSGSYIFDVTDPYAPELVSFVEVPKGSHNHTVHPDGDHMYISNSELITSVAGEVGIEVYDISDLENPEQVGFLPLPVRPGLGTESHDITFDEDGSRAYSAALSQTVIIDTEDPANPSVISSFVDPAINVEHQSDPVTLTDPVLGERDFLFVEDEVAGATPTGQCPNGGVHVYDVTGDLENNPVKVGYWNISDVGPTNDGLGRCTAHVFELHADEQLMTIAYYNGGVRVVDLSGLVGVALGDLGMGMRELAKLRFDDSDTWAVKAPFVDRDGTFHIYGNDQARGFDVYEVDLSGGELTASDTPGTWMTPQQAVDLAQSNPVDLTEYTPRCLLPPADA